MTDTHLERGGHMITDQEFEKLEPGDTIVVYDTVPRGFCTVTTPGLDSRIPWVMVSTLDKTGSAHTLHLNSRRLWVADLSWDADRAMLFRGNDDLAHLDNLPSSLAEMIRSQRTASESR